MQMAEEGLGSGIVIFIDFTIKFFSDTDQWLVTCGCMCNEFCHRSSLETDQTEQPESL